MYPVFDWSISLLTIMGVSAGAISLGHLEQWTFGRVIDAVRGC
jgi:hypothetical protein